MTNNSQFQSGSGVYTCSICQKRTRETGSCESGTDLCVSCFDREGRRNTHTDNHDTPEADCEFCHDEAEGSTMSGSARAAREDAR